MPWPLASPGHQQPRYYWCSIWIFLSSLGVNCPNSQIPECTCPISYSATSRTARHMHISVLNVVLWDMKQVHSGICKTGLFQQLGIFQYWRMKCIYIFTFSQINSARHALTHCGLVMPYGNTNHGQHWLKSWFVAWPHKAITWFNVGLSSIRSCCIHLKVLSQEYLHIPVSKIGLKIAFLKIPSRSLRGQWVNRHI